MPSTPTAPRPVRSGRNSRLAPGRVVGAAAGGRVVLPGPACGGEVGLVELVLGRLGGLHRQTPSAVGQRITTSTCSMAAIWWTVAHSRSSRSATPVSLRLKA